MGFEHGQKPIEAELPLAMQTAQPEKASGFVPRRRTVTAGLLVGLTLWFAHKRYAFAPEPWLEGRLDHSGYDKPGLLAGKEVEELFLWPLSFSSLPTPTDLLLQNRAKCCKCNRILEGVYFKTALGWIKDRL